MPKSRLELALAIIAVIVIVAVTSAWVYGVAANFAAGP
jgi:hypothetical protein